MTIFTKTNSVLLLIATVIINNISYTKDHVKYRDEIWPNSLPADQYTAQVRENCSELYTTLKNLMKKTELTEQEKEEIVYLSKIHETMKYTDKKLDFKSLLRQDYKG